MLERIWVTAHLRKEENILLLGVIFTQINQSLFPLSALSGMRIPLLLGDFELAL